MQLEIITPDSKVFNGNAVAVIMPGIEGSFEILDHHAAMVSALRDGDITINTGTAKETFHVSGGVVEVFQNHVSVLAEGVSH